MIASKIQLPVLMIASEIQNVDGIRQVLRTIVQPLKELRAGWVAADGGASWRC